MSAVPYFPVSSDVVACCECGVVFASTILAKRRNDHLSFYCPVGHRQSFLANPRTEEYLRLELERTKRARDAAESSLKQQKELTKWANATAKRNHTILRKTKERIANGVCPCCHRSFENLHRHMQSQHPSFKKEVL